MLKLILPRLGQTMEEARLEAWMIGPGIAFSAGHVLYEVETEKVTTGVEATVDGTLVRRLVDDGAELHVGAVLAVIAEPGEEPTEAEIDAFLDGADMATPEAPPGSADASDIASPPRHSVVRAMPRTRALARELGVDLSGLEPDQRSGRVTEEAVRAASKPTPIPDIQQQVAPSPSPTTAVIPAPVMRAPDRAPQDALPEMAGGPAIREARPIGPVGRRMAEVLTKSWATVPQFSQSVTVDTSPWPARRARMREQTGLDIGYTDLMIAALVRAVQDVPEINSSFAGDVLRIYHDINISLAVDSPQGLQVPVLHRLQELSDAGRARVLRERTGQARDGSLSLDDVTGGTITLSNLGMYGIEGGVPLVTFPQTCIVFIGTISKQVVPVGDAIGIRPMCPIVCSFDHRAVDGATAARFMAALKRHLQEPNPASTSSGVAPHDSRCS